tara:strand:+ start:813 stop:977 length:165 start_codon:yes stop_codon:yes gene_type:complete
MITTILIDKYNDSFIDQAIEVIDDLSKIPAAAWTDQDFARNVWAINMLSQIKGV